MGRETVRKGYQPSSGKKPMTEGYQPSRRSADASHTFVAPKPPRPRPSSNGKSHSRSVQELRKRLPNLEKDLVQIPISEDHYKTIGLLEIDSEGILIGIPGARGMSPNAKMEPIVRYQLQKSGFYLKLEKLKKDSKTNM